MSVKLTNFNLTFAPLSLCLRWWDLTLQNIKLSAALTVLPSVSCYKAISVLKEKAIDQAPVVDKSGYISLMSL